MEQPMSLFLAAAALLLLVVIAAQNYLYTPLRQETISDGLYGPYHWFLDGAYVVLATALVMAFKDKGFSELLAYFASACLMITAISNTFSGFVDKITNGKHSNIHTWATVAMLLTMLGLEGHVSGWKWVAANAVIPAIVGLFAKLSKKVVAGPAAEKAGIAVLCAWMISLVF
jgi:hypothetical protein